VERIQKIISEAGICSRRRAEELIKNGKVLVNGRIANIGDKANPEKDEIKVDGELIKPQRKVYIMLNKPEGYVSTTKSQFGQKTVMEILKGLKERVYPVGRLDVDTEGLLLLTSDGEFANNIMHPKYEVKKTYFAVLDGELSRENYKQLKNGMEIDGKVIMADSIKRVGKRRYRLVIHEGMKRVVKKLFLQMGFRVRYLLREKIGGLSLGKLPKGKWRELTKKEIELIFSDDFLSPSEKS